MKKFSILLCLTVFISLTLCTNARTESKSFNPFDEIVYLSNTPESGSEDKYSFKEDYDAIENAAQSVFYVEIYDSNNQPYGTGSGFVAFDEHLFVTNQHVIEGASFLRIWDDNDQVYTINQVVESDKNQDIALLSFPEGQKYIALNLGDTEKLKRGQPVVTIGSPKGLQNTVAEGIISAFPTLNGMKMIQISAPISHGSSGGCLFDNSGDVIGITSAGLDDGQNLNFAIPITNVQQLYSQWDKKELTLLGSEKSWNTTGSVSPVSDSSSTSSLQPGQIVSFGHYEQDGNLSNGKEEIEWIVLDVQGDKCLLLSKYGLDSKAYNDLLPAGTDITELSAEDIFALNTDTTWENCTLRNWLNNDFIQMAFSADEQSIIQETSVDNSSKQGYSKWNTSGGNNTLDKLFLLSFYEMSNLYVNDPCTPTDYAIDQGAKQYGDNDSEGAHWWWWLRSPGSSQSEVICLNDNLTNAASGYSFYVGFCVRPALWIDLAHSAPSETPTPTPTSEPTPAPTPTPTPEPEPDTAEPIITNPPTDAPATAPAVPSETLVGDITNDNLVNVYDLIRLQKYLSDNSIQINETAADINGDGMIDLQDEIELTLILTNQ